MWKLRGPKEQWMDNYVAYINAGKGCAVVKKEHDDDYIQEGVPVTWRRTQLAPAVRTANPDEFQTVGSALYLPLQPVYIPSKSEIFEIYDGGVPKNFENVRFQSKTDFGDVDATGAILVVDPSEIFEGPMYYLPAPLYPTTSRVGEPHYITLRDDSLPTYIYWKPAENADGQHTRVARSGAPSPELAAPQKTRAQAPAPITVNNKPETVEKGTKRQAVWEVFNPKAEEDPIGFLEYYNTKSKGYNMIRSKMMLREEDIERVNYISPCLRHNVEQVKDVSADGSKKDASAEGSKKDAGAQGSKKDAPRSKAPPFKKVAPIADDDPWFLAFKQKLQRRDVIRNARLHPAPVFTPVYCNHPQGRQDPKKATLTRDLYMEYWQRAKLAERELEERSLCCRACGLDWSKTDQTSFEHYNQHRQEYTRWLKVEHPEQPAPEPVVRAANLAPPTEGVPDLGWFRKLEKIILDKENELLEREQICHVCDKALDYAFVDPADHYMEHIEQRKALRALGAAADAAKSMKPAVASNMVTDVEAVVQYYQAPVSAGSDESQISPPLTTFLRNHIPQAVFERHEQATKQARELGTKGAPPLVQTQKIRSKALDSAQAQLARIAAQEKIIEPKPETKLPSPKSKLPSPKSIKSSPGDNVSERLGDLQGRQFKSDFWKGGMYPDAQPPQWRVEKVTNLPPLPGTDSEAVLDEPRTPATPPFRFHEFISKEDHEQGMGFLDDFSFDGDGKEAPVPDDFETEPETEAETELETEPETGLEVKDVDVEDEEVFDTEADDVLDAEADGVIDLTAELTSESSSQSESEVDIIAENIPNSVRPSQRQRPTPLKSANPPSRKRKSSDPDYMPSPEGPKHPDELSPVLRLPKKRKSGDKTFRPSKDDDQSTSPPATPKKVKITPKKKARSAERAAKWRQQGGKGKKVSWSDEQKKVEKAKKEQKSLEKTADTTTAVKDGGVKKNKKQNKNTAVKKADKKGKAEKAQEAQEAAIAQEVQEAQKTKKAAKPKKVEKTKKTPKAKMSEAVVKVETTPTARPKRKAAEGKKYYNQERIIG